MKWNCVLATENFNHRRLEEKQMTVIKLAPLCGFSISSPESHLRMCLYYSNHKTQPCKMKHLMVERRHRMSIASRVSYIFSPVGI